MEVLNKEQVDLVQKGISAGMEYQEYRSLVHFLAENHQTTGAVQSESNINYTQLNDRRMARWDKTFKIASEIQERIEGIHSRLMFLVLAESWCGDASPSLPVMNKIAELNPNIGLKIVLRDENLELMDAFLTQGTRSIPKLIVFDEESGEIVGEWGPRPSTATVLVEDYKQKYGKLTPEFKKDLQVWYNADKGQNILGDVLELLPLE
ncbi:MAG: thioredoxin family protein [Allomuricauda sp.]